MVLFVGVVYERKGTCVPGSLAWDQIRQVTHRVKVLEDVTRTFQTAEGAQIR